MEAYWYRVEQMFWKPLFRERCTFLLYKKFVYLFGGFGGQRYNDLNQLNLESFRWVELSKQGNLGKSPSARHSHCMNLYKDQIIVSGGEVAYN